MKTFAVLATLVSFANTPAETIYRLVKTVFENFDDFKKLHPALADPDKKQMVTEGPSASLHPGAMKYFKDDGLR